MRANHAYTTIDMIVLAFGIVGNILVIVSILRQKYSLKNNYCFLVLQLAINDLGVLFFYLLENIINLILEKSPYTYSITYRLFNTLTMLFQVAGIGIMLVISVLRHRATIHPLKPPISRGKLKVIFCLVYIAGFIAGYGPTIPLVLMYGKDTDIATLYDKLHSEYLITCYYLPPTLVMAILYFQVCRELIKQKKRIKILCSNTATQSTCSSSFNILTFIRNRRAAIVCACTVVCYGVGNIPMSVWFAWEITGEHRLLQNYAWVRYFANVFRVVGCHAINPVIYGILDRKLLSFWKICFKRRFRIR